MLASCSRFDNSTGFDTIFDPTDDAATAHHHGQLLNIDGSVDSVGLAEDTLDHDDDATPAPPRWPDFIIIALLASSLTMIAMAIYIMAMAGWADRPWPKPVSERLKHYKNLSMRLRMPGAPRMTMSSSPSAPRRCAVIAVAALAFASDFLPTTMARRSKDSHRCCDALGIVPLRSVSLS